MEKLVALAKVDWYNEYEEDIAQRIKTDYIVLTSITSFSKAIEEIEEHYGQDLIKVELELIEGPFLTIDKDTYERILKEEN